MSIFSDLSIREGKDRSKEGVLYNLAACYALAEKMISDFLAPHGLSPVKMNALLIIRSADKKEGLSQREISKKMIVSAGNITRLIDRLEKDGLVERFSVKGDRRKRLIRVTRKAGSILDKIWPLYKKEVDRIVSLLSAREIDAAEKILNAFREKLQKIQRNKKHDVISDPLSRR